MSQNNQKHAWFYLVFTFFIWGSVYVAGKMIADDIPPSLVACLRCVTAMLPLCLMSRTWFQTKIDKQDYKYFFLVGGLGYFLTIQLIQLGISLTGASMASLINAMTPIAVTILAALILKETITPIKVLCLLLALAGAVIISFGARAQGSSLGIFVILTGVVSFGWASVYMRQLTKKYPPVLVTTYSMAISLLFHVPVGIVAAITQPVKLSTLGIGVILYLGFAGSGIAQYTWTKSLSLLPAGTCSLFYPLQPVFSALLGAWLLHETFSPTFFYGLLLISIDVALVTWENHKLASASEKKEASKV